MNSKTYKFGDATSKLKVTKVNPYTNVYDIQEWKDESHKVFNILGIDEFDGAPNVLVMEVNVKKGIEFMVVARYGEGQDTSAYIKSITKKQFCDFVNTMPKEIEG